jgi:hypothetical protein
VNIEQSALLQRREVDSNSWSLAEANREIALGLDALGHVDNFSSRSLYSPPRSAMNYAFARER